jgi:prepilin-type N-terminal cleavage/methylation domain-containing protein
MKNRKAFTLIEVLVVLVIVAMLMGVLFEIYITISRITFRVELQKNVNEELLFVTDSLQNLSNRNQIDYSRYTYDMDEAVKYNLYTSDGVVEKLFLT